VLVQLVRYGSRLTYDEVMERFEGRSDRYRDEAALTARAHRRRARPGAA
jgi:hypothetical protein